MPLPKDGWFLNFFDIDGMISGKLSVMEPTRPNFLDAAMAGPIAKRGEWFYVEIIAKDESTAVLVNGREVVALKHPGVIPTAGVLNLWNNDLLEGVAFRNIEIKDLTPPTPKTPEDGPPVVAFEPRTLNLLAIIGAKQDTNVVNAEIEKDAAWSLGEGELTSPAVGQGVAEFPYIPPDEYDFRIEFTCFGGLPEVNQFLARRDRSFSCMLGAGAQGTKFGLQMIGCLNVAENTTGVDRPRMTLNERHACVVHVRNNQVSAELDGEEFVRWKTDYSDLGLDHPVVKHWTMARRNRALLAVGTNGTKTIFHKAEVVEISGNGRFSRPDDPAIRSGKWKIRRAAPKELPHEQPGWVQIFNGKDLTGWNVMGHTGWKAQDGVLIGETNGPKGWLMSDKNYADFELSLEYKMTAGSNSGVFLWAWPEGPIDGGQFMEIQLIDDAIDDANGANPKHRTGAICHVVAPDPAPSAPVNQWHQLHLRVQGRQVNVTFDGQKILAANLDDHRDLFDRFPGLTKTTGRIGLQLYPGHTDFKNIRVKKLPPAEAGWVPLFNGKDLTGWKTLPGKKTDWKVDAGELVGRSSPESLLFSESGKYQDFHLKAEVKLTAEGNSGVLFRTKFDGAPGDSITGYEADLDFTPGTPSSPIGTLWKESKRVQRALKGTAVPDQWFSMEVIAKGS